MPMSKETYQKYAEAGAPKSPLGKDMLRAFWVGGFICILGQALNDLYTGAAGMDKETAGALTSATLVALAALLTGMGWFDRLAKYAGAGTLLPITGFANAVVSPAIDSRAEGWVLGVGAKVFTVAGPVLLYGTLAGVLYGVVYWIITLF